MAQQEFSPEDINAAMQLMALAYSGNMDAAKKIQDNMAAFQAIIPHIQKAQQGVMDASMLPPPNVQPGGGNRTTTLPAFPRPAGAMTLDQAQAAQNPKRQMLLGEEGGPTPPKPGSPAYGAKTMEQMIAEGKATSDTDPDSGLRYDTLYMPPEHVSGSPPKAPKAPKAPKVASAATKKTSSEYVPMAAPDEGNLDHLIGTAVLNFLQEAASGAKPKLKR